MKDVKVRVGELIREARISKGLTLREAGAKMGVSEGVFSKYETGKQNLTLETVQKIADTLEVDINTFFK